MNKKTIPFLQGEVKSDLDLIDKMIQIHAVVKGIHLRPFERSVLKYYLKYGYSRETIEKIKEWENKTHGNMKTTNSYLISSGFLEKGVNNEKKGNLSPEMEDLRKKINGRSTYTFVCNFSK